MFTQAVLLLLYTGKTTNNTFNSTINVEIMSNMFENINKSNFVAKYLNGNAYITI